MGKLQIGSVAPDFTLFNQNGDAVRLQDILKNKKVVLYFYPKNETAGCTKEACAFRDEYEEFVAAGAEVIGISADSVASHQQFADNRRLPFILLSDPDMKVHQLYGAKPSFFGILKARLTFVIDKNGIIRHRFDSALDFTGHVITSLGILQGQN